MSDMNFTIPGDHSSLPGHFPGNPVVPGAVLLAEIVRVLGPFRKVRSVKFLSPLSPEVACTIEINNRPDASTSVTVKSSEATILTATIEFRDVVGKGL